MDRLTFELKVEAILLKQLPGVVLSATDGHAKYVDFTQNGDELISEFVALVDSIGELYDNLAAPKLITKGDS